MLVVAFFHSAFNSAWGTGDEKLANELLSSNALPYAVVAVAVVLAIMTRGRLAASPSARDRDRPRRRGWLVERDAHLPGGVAGPRSDE